MELAGKKDYDRFVERFRQGLSKFKGVCFYGYGSYFDRRCNYGRSDIDGGIILDSNVLTDKERISELARVFALAQKPVRIKTQFNLLDLGTARDGRFLSYTKDYTDWLKRKAKVVFGEDYLGKLNGIGLKSGILHNASFNFRKVRNLLLYSHHLMETEAERFVEKTGKSLESIAKFPKVLVFLRNGEVVVPIKDAKKEVEKFVGNIDLSFIERLELLLRDPARFYSELENPYNSRRLLSQGLDCFERMIYAYINKFSRGE